MRTLAHVLQDSTNTAMESGDRLHDPLEEGNWYSTSLTLKSPLFYLQERVFWLMDEVARAHGTGNGGDEETTKRSGKNWSHFHN